MVVRTCPSGRPLSGGDASEDRGTRLSITVRLDDSSEATLGGRTWTSSDPLTADSLNACTEHALIVERPGTEVPDLEAWIVERVLRVLPGMIVKVVSQPQPPPGAVI